MPDVLDLPGEQVDGLGRPVGAALGGVLVLLQQRCLLLQWTADPNAPGSRPGCGDLPMAMLLACISSWCPGGPDELAARRSLVTDRVERRPRRGRPHDSVALAVRSSGR